MKYWLIKTEPGTWSWDDQMNAPKKTTQWDGVKNYQANNYLKEMSKGDLCFFYHSVKQKTIVGAVKVVKPWQPDMSLPNTPWGYPTVQAIEAAKAPVTLANIKTKSSLKDMVLVNNSRLSVQPVKASEWRIICEMADFSEKCAQ